MSTVPPAVRRLVLTELGRRFDVLRWEETGPATASDMYDRFVTDPAIGGRLAPFMPSAKIRVWIKDGPAKEYRRGLEGQGYMKTFTTRAYPGPEAVVRSALGKEWSPVLESLNEKPMRCLAQDGRGRSQFVIWGPFASLQALVWNSCLLRVASPEYPVTIAVTKPSQAPLGDDDWELVKKVAQVVQAHCTQVTYAVSRKSSGTDFAFTGGS